LVRRSPEKRRNHLGPGMKPAIKTMGEQKKPKAQ
jgi:hypothetical protein